MKKKVQMKKFKRQKNSLNEIVQMNSSNEQKKIV